MKVLVDTGATNTIIRLSTLGEIKHHQFFPAQEKFLLADQSTFSILGYVPLQVTIEHVNTFIMAAVSRTLCCDVVLGEDWIKRYKVTVNRFKNLVQILGNTAAVPLTTSDSRQPIPFQLCRSISVQPNTHRRIDAFVGITPASIATFFPNRCLQEQKNIIFVTDLMYTSIHPRTITIFNRNKFPVTLLRGTHIGSVSINYDRETYGHIISSSLRKSDFSPFPASHCSQRSTENDERYQENEVDRTINKLVDHITNPRTHNALHNMLQSYRKLFDQSKPTIAITPIHHTIPTANHPPTNSIPYRGSLEQQKILQQLIDQLEKTKQIRPSSSPWSSPALLIKKKDGGHRFVVDYRKLNAITMKDSFPIPTIESTLQQLGGNRFFSKLDLRSGYFQIPINELDKPKTAFITSTGLWEFNVLPMGLCNAPPVFQRIMSNLIVRGHEHFCLVYLDDIIIFSQTLDDHINHLDEICRILHNHRFQLHSSKCSILRSTIDYLGHSIDRFGIKPLHDNIKAIRDLPFPNDPSLKQANTFIGGIAFYRKFIKNFAMIAAPIHRVTNLSKDNQHKFQWTDEQREAVRRLKAAITGPELMLEFPDPNLPFILSTDASTIGIGAVLKQRIPDGQIKVIHYLSRMLSKSERHYSTTELEALAMVWSITKLRCYLLNKDFSVETDHCPLCQFHKKKSRNGRLDRWSIEILSEYNITEINYKKGKCHCDADLLSRYPLDDDTKDSLNNRTRRQNSGYLFQHFDELEAMHSDLQPTATINVITRSMTSNQRLKSSDRQPQLEIDEVSPPTTIRTYNIRSKTNHARNTSSVSTSESTQDPKLSSLSHSNKPATSILSSNAVSKPFDLHELQAAQQSDDEIQARTSKLIPEQDFTMVDGLLYKLVRRGTGKIPLLWIPKSMIQRVLFLHHDHFTAGHFGHNKTFHKVNNKYYWPNMYTTITNYIKSCVACAKHNYVRTKRPGTMNITPLPNEVMGLVGMDYWGPTIQPTRQGNRYVLTMTDYLSKFVFAKAMQTNSAQEAADFFLDVCYHFGAPVKLITDQGSHFVAELMRTIVESCNTTHVLATPYHPTSIAQTERFNATFAPALSKLMAGQTSDWDDFLQPVIYAYNTSQHNTTKFTPFQLMFAREHQLLMEPKQMKICLSKSNPYYERTRKARQLILHHAKLNIQNCARLAKIRYDHNRPNPSYCIGDLVLLRVIIRSNKLQEKYEGPYRIIAQKGPSTYIVRLESPNDEHNPNYLKQVTTADMKPIVMNTE